MLQFHDRILTDRIMDPSPFRAVDDQPGVLQHAKMKRESRLACVERFCKITYTPLAVPKLLQDSHSHLIRQRMKEADRLLPCFCPGCYHGSFIHQQLLISQAPSCLHQTAARPLHRCKLSVTICCHSSCITDRKRLSYSTHCTTKYQSSELINRPPH